MEEYREQSDFVFVDRRAGMPLNRAQPSERTEMAPEAEPVAPVSARRLQIHVPDGAPKLLLLQTAAALVLLAVVAVGLWLGGSDFRKAYMHFTTQNEFRLLEALEPITSQTESMASSALPSAESVALDAVQVP